MTTRGAQNNWWKCFSEPEQQITADELGTYFSGHSDNFFHCDLCKRSEVYWNGLKWTIPDNWKTDGENTVCDNCIKTIEFIFK